MDQIKIENLKVYAYHGVYESEKDKGQNFYVNATLYTDVREAALNDDYEMTTDYAAVCQVIKETMVSRTFDLIETVAERVAEAILATFPKIESAVLPGILQRIFLCIRLSFRRCQKP